jgi:tetratricopeptide (TPR) repeat protein
MLPNLRNPRNPRLIFFLVVMIAVPALAQEPGDQEPRVRIQIDVTATVPDDEHWIELQSRNFLVAGTASEGDIRKVAADLELLRETFAQFNPRARAISSVPTTVIVFDNTTSIRWYWPADAGPPDRAKGYVQAGLDKNYIVLTEGSIPREVYRDYIRLLIPEAMGPVPLWFREGLADYFSGLKVNRFLIGDKRWTRLGNGIDEYDALLNKKAKLLSFVALSRVHEESPEYEDPKARDLFLAQSWGVVHYLMSRPGGAGAMQRVFNMLGDGQTLENAIRQSFGRGVGLNLFEDAFKDYIRLSQREHQWSGSIQMLSKSESQVAKGECGMIMLVGISAPRFGQCNWSPEPDPPGVFRIPYAFDKTWAEVHPLKARELSEPEAWFYRGDLMLHIGRLGEAEAYLRRAIQQPPQASRTHASMGLLHLQKKRYSDSAASLEMAAELDPKNYLAHYYNAVLIRARGQDADNAPSYDDLEDIHNGLLKVISLAPQFVEAAEMLAGINLIRRTATPQSEKALLDGLKRYPGRSSTWIALANVAARGGDSAGARWLLTRLLAAGAPDAGSRKAGTSLLDGLAPGTGRALMTAPISAGTQTGAVRISGVAQPNTRPANRTQGEKVRGVLTHIECKKGLTFTVKTGGKSVKLHADSAFSVEFIARDREGRAVPSSPVVCGPVVGPDAERPEGIDVTITYRPGRSNDSIGEPLTVEIQVED